jgi:hypothetical protein
MEGVLGNAFLNSGPAPDRADEPRFRGDLARNGGDSGGMMTMSQLL